MKTQNFWCWLFVLTLAFILLSPLAYWMTGIGQSAGELSAQVRHAADGTPLSSPRAEARHRLSLPMRIELLLIYPLLLISFQLSGGTLQLRRWLDERVQPALSQRMPWLARGLAWVGRLVPSAWRERLAGRDLLVVLFFVLALEFALFWLYLPFNFYREFIVGHQFGLSTQDVSGWMADRIKGLLINLVLGGAGWTGLYGLMRLMPRRWPITAGVAMIALNAVLVVVTPILITPLFFEVTPLDDPDMRSRILALSERAGFQVDEVYVLNASSKMTTVNAYFTGYGDARRIVLYDTLLTGYTPDQVEVVLAHEMGHWRYQHLLLALLGMGAAGWIGLFGLRWLLRRTWRWLKLSGPADVAGLPYVMAVIAVVTLLSLPVQNVFARYAERQADHFSLAVSQKPEDFIQLFEQFAVDNLSLVDVSLAEKIVFYTHPPIVERIEMAEAFRRSVEVTP
jgi:STE24 endopeptidase